MPEPIPESNIELRYMNSFSENPVGIMPNEELEKRDHTIMLDIVIWQYRNT